MDQSIQRSLTSASALRTNLVKLHRHLESLTAKEEAVIRTNKENESAAVRQEAAEEEHSSDDEFQEVGIAEISNVERKKKPEKLVDKLLPSLKADLLVRHLVFHCYICFFIVLFRH